MSSSRPSVAELRAVGQPPGLLDRRSGEHWAGRYYMRRVSPYVSWLAVRVGLSANAVTGVMIVLGLAGAGAVAVPHVAGAVAGAALIQVYLLLDCTDGEVARWRRTTSTRGAYLDRVGHYVVEASLMAGLGARASDWAEPAWVIVGLGAAVFVLVAKAETDLVDVARHHAGLGPVSDDAAVMVEPRMAAGRRLASYLPVHRIVHAVEASLLIVAAAVADAVAGSGSLAVTRGLTVAMASVAGLVAVLHLVSVLTSRRLTET